LDLNRYHPYATDRGVIAWPADHTNPGGKLGPKTIKFTIKAMSIELSRQARRRQEEYDRMIRLTSREARKSEKAGRGKRGEHEADEL
jgi:hypothetical protein